MLLKLKELWIIFKEFWTALWDAILGVFLYSRHFRRQERLKQQQDEHFHFREESKRKMSKWVTKERARIERLKQSDSVPKKYKNDYSIYNYLASVVMQKNPNWTVEQTVKAFYDYLHPYIFGYWNLYTQFKTILNSDDPDGEFRRRKVGLKSRVNSMPNVYGRALDVLNIKKKVTEEIREEEKKYRKHKRNVQNKLDLEMVRIDKEIAERQKKNAETKLKQLEEEKEQS